MVVAVTSLFEPVIAQYIYDIIVLAGALAILCFCTCSTEHYETIRLLAHPDAPCLPLWLALTH